MGNPTATVAAIRKTVAVPINLEAFVGDLMTSLTTRASMPRALAAATTATQATA
jgi:hypothetical protein